MAVVVQTQVIVPNLPGEIERLCRAIAEADVNVQAVMMKDDADVSTVRLVLDKPRLGREALAKHGFAATESKILAVLLTDRPGELWRVSAALAAKQVNIQYSYLATKSVHGQAVVLMAVGGVGPERASDILRESGYECVDQRGLGGLGVPVNP